MRSTKKQSGGFTPQESLISLLPSVVAGLIVLAATIITSLIDSSSRTRLFLCIYWAVGSVYLLAYYYLLTKSFFRERFSWTNSIISSVALSLLSMLIHDNAEPLFFTLIFIAAASTSLTSSRGPSYLLALLPVVVDISRDIVIENTSFPNLLIEIGFVAAAIVAIESIQQIKGTARKQINRLEVVNEVSRQIISSIETRQVFSLLNAAFQNALEADSYYIGIVDEADPEQIRLELFYDEGENFEGMRLARKGTLSNWVITHQQDLFLPDLREEVYLEDVEMVIIGKQKTALSWLGVPIRGSHINGVMAISAYRPNAFDRSDMELLSNIAQRAALALDNAHHHALVEEQARLDSLTQVYNHGYFIKLLKERIEENISSRQPISLIMLDIDFFKQYNDKFGHLAGDEILINLCNIMREHVKKKDAIGRWGGEEFSILLPNTTAEQALQVANRIRNSMSSLEIQSEAGVILAPTISQGIATFPHEANEAMKLIDIADKRLYVAKKRGRDQIETAPAIQQTK